ncbi:MAG: hypothetical protein BroJett013_06920 [Alphaproteobacteria bacterium]|nr:MAG: hypothetical protein BroJett013_06920 [Alphaproteobacteria bacterium]
MAATEEDIAFEQRAHCMDAAIFDGILAGIRTLQQVDTSEQADIAAIFAGMSGAVVRMIGEFRAPGLSMRFCIERFADGMHELAKQTHPGDYQ